MRRLRYISILVCLVAIGFFVWQNAPHYRIISGEIFGTFYKIKIRTDKKDKELQNKIKAELEDVNKQMSVFEPESDVSKINRLPAGKQIKLTPDMQIVLSAMRQVWQQTDGRFDPTLAPLIELWGFGTDKNRRTPTDKEIKQALRSVGVDKLTLKKDILTKKNAKTALNLSAIAKGYGVDKVAALLDKEGYQNYVVEIGGEVKAKGTRTENGDFWSIGVNRPMKGSAENMLVLSMENLAAATSGNYRNFYEQDGKAYAHTISSKTGRPVQTDVLSATVFHPSCMYADAYATSLMVFGVADGLAFADKYQLPVILIDTAFEMHFSKAADDLFGEP